MSKLIRRKKEIGAALIVALQLITVTLIGLMLPYGSGPQPVKAPAGTQMSAPAQQAAPALQQTTQTDQAPTVQPLTPAEKSALRKSAVFAKKLQEPLATQVFNLATSRAESAQQSGQRSSQQSGQQSMQQGESSNEGPTLTTDQEDYQPYTYVYFTGTGFQPGETVNMIVVELDPVPQSFQPWDVVADENGNFQTSWYVFSEEFRGATLEATATGDTSGLTASARFTDAAFNYSPTSQSLTASAGGPAVSFTQSVMTTGSNHGQAFGAMLQLSGSTLPAGVTVSTTPTSLSFSGGVETKSWSVAFTVASGTAAGTYTVSIQANPDAGTGVGPGMGTTVTLTITGNQPPVAVCQNVTVSAGPNCTASASIDNHSFDPDSGDTISLSQSPAGPYSLGNTSVTLTVTDSHGASSTCSATVTVNDTTAPVPNASSLSDVTGQCSANLPAAPTATDNCDGAITGTPSNPGPFSQGDTTITWTFTDSHGNSSTQTQAVHVHDTMAPVPDASSLADVTGQCSANLPAAPTATDNCDGAITGTPSNPGPFSQGDTTITWTFTDSHGNSSTQTQAVHVHDTTAPVPDASSLADVTGQCSANLPAAPTATDNCDGAITGTPSNPGPFSQGDTTITWTFTDSHNNSSSQTQAVHVHDTTAPVPDAPSLADVTGQCSANLPTAPTATDNCDSGVITGVPDNAGPFGQGDTTITWTFTDSHNNSSSQTQAVHVHDTTAPVPNAGSLPDVTAQCSANLPAPPTATDNCDGTINGTPSSPGPFGQGDFVITWTFTDSHNNSSSQTQAVHVHDTTAPVPNAGSLPDVTAQCSANLPAPPTATDNCDGTINGTPSSPGPFGQGDFVITWTFTDSQGNHSSQTQAVHVHDTTAPVPNAGSLPDVTAQCSANLPAPPTATDNCDGTINGTPSSPGPFGQGDFVITWTFTDSQGNHSSQTQAVHVHDTTAPVPNAGSLPDVTAQCSANLPAAPTATDNCDGAINGTPDMSGPFGQGDFVITWTFTDSHGNHSSQTQAVHVHDTTPPVITHCASPRAITATCPTTVPDLTGEVTATDNCGGAVTVTQTPAAGTQISVGTTTVTLHVKDALNNEATCTATLTVSYGWNGFFPPVDNTPVLNRVKAGSAIPVKFSLGCNQGLNIFAAGYPQSGQMQCDNQDPLDDIEQTVNAGGSSLNYDPVANQYIYVWKTDKTWAGTCRLLTLQLADGTYHYAFFNFTR